MPVFMVLSSWQGHCESSLGSFDEYRLSAKWLPTLRPSRPTWAVSLPLGGTHRRHLLLFWSSKAAFYVFHGGLEAESSHLSQSEILSSVIFLVSFGLPSQILDLGLSGHRRSFVLVFFSLYFLFLVTCYVKLTTPTRLFSPH